MWLHVIPSHTFRSIEQFEGVFKLCNGTLLGSRQALLFTPRSEAHRMHKHGCVRWRESHFWKWPHTDV